MPLYDFECGSCGVVFERIVGSDVTTQPCTNCTGLRCPRRVPIPAPPKFTGGRSEQGQREHAEKTRKQLDRRSRDYDRTTAGKEQRYNSIKRLQKNGSLPPGVKL